MSRRMQPYQKIEMLPHERPLDQYRFYVTGHGNFPLEMLQVTQSWPWAPVDAAKISREDKRRSIQLISFYPPHPEVWRRWPNWEISEEIVT